jgi:hypothetical protein
VERLLAGSLGEESDDGTTSRNHEAHGRILAKLHVGILPKVGAQCTHMVELGMEVSSVQKLLFPLAVCSSSIVDRDVAPVYQYAAGFSSL